MAIVDGHIHTNRLMLREVGVEDLPTIYRWAVSPISGRTWRYRNLQPSYEQFASELNVGVLAQLLAVRASRPGDPVCLVTAYDPSGALHAKLAVLTAPRWINSGLSLEACEAMITWLFREFSLRKLFAETLTSVSDGTLASALNHLFRQEGRLVDYEIGRSGGYEDLFIHSITADAWDSEAIRNARKLIGRVGIELPMELEIEIR